MISHDQEMTYIIEMTLIGGVYDIVGTYLGVFGLMNMADTGVGMPKKHGRWSSVSVAFFYTCVLSGFRDVGF